MHASAHHSASYGRSLPGRLIREDETLAQALRQAFEPQAGLAPRAASFAQPRDRTRLLLDELFNLPEELSCTDARIVYRGYVDDPRNTDHAWIETTAVHFHMSRELASKIRLQSYSQAGSESRSARSFMGIRSARSFMGRTLRSMSSRRGADARTGGPTSADEEPDDDEPEDELWISTETPASAKKLRGLFLRSARQRMTALEDIRVCWRDVDENLKLYASQQQWACEAVKQRLLRHQPIDTMRQLTIGQLDTTLVLRLSCHAAEHENKRGGRRTGRDAPGRNRLDRSRSGSFGGKLGLEVLDQGCLVASERSNSVEECIEKLRRLAHKLKKHELSEEDVKNIKLEVSRLLLQAACNDFMRASSNMVSGKGGHALGVALVARCGRYDVLHHLLMQTSSGTSAAARAEMVQEALQEVLLRVTDPSFDVRIVDLLLQYGAKVSEVSLSTLFGVLGMSSALGARLPFDLPDTTPWREEHVLMLRQHIVGFDYYAARQRTVRAFDLLVWGICCGATGFVKVIWERTVSPLRAALIGQEVCRKLRVSLSAESDELVSLEKWFETNAVALLDTLDNQETARKLLLTSEGDSAELGTRHRRSSLFEVAVELENKKFISHRFCQALVEEMWNGRSAACGRIMLRSKHSSPLTLVLGLIWQLIFFPIHWPWIWTELNDLYRWPIRPIAEEGARQGFDPTAKGHVLTMRVHRYEHLVGLLQIPLVKRVLDMVSHYAFTGIFVWVSFLPLCQPLYTAHLVLFIWVVAKACQLALFVATVQGWGRKHYSVYKWVDALTIISLLAFFACALWFRRGDPFASLSAAEATDLIAFLDLRADGRLRARHDSLPGQSQSEHYFLQHGGGWQHGAPAGNCGWTVATEVLRTLLAIAALPIFFSLTEIFSVSETLGALIIAASRMAYDLRFWLPLVIVIGSGFGVALNLLLPHYQVIAIDCHLIAI